MRCRVDPDRVERQVRPLDLGRTHRLVTPDQRHAPVARDQRCAYPGCDLAARWTDLDNLVPLCRRHHRILHHPEWTIHIRDGLPEFTPPKWIDPHQRSLRNVLRQ